MPAKPEASTKPEASANYDRLDQLVRRFEKLFNILIPVVAIAVSLLIGSIIILAQGASSLEAYAALLSGAFGNAYNLSNSLVMATPALPAPFTTTRQSSFFLPTTFNALMMPASTTMAVPC